MDKKELERYRHGYEKASEYYNLFANNEDLPFYLSFAEQQGSPVLDLAAGTGRVSLYLAQRGFDIVSLEISKPMIKEFKKQLDRDIISSSKRIRLIEGDMRDFTLDTQFPLIIIPTSFGHALTRNEQLSLLNCVRDHLLDDGIFVADLFPAENQPEYASFEEPAVDLGDGRVVTRRGIIKSDLQKKLLSLELTFTVIETKTRNIIDEIHLVSGVALIYPHEFDKLLQQTGLEIIDEFGDFDKSPYSESSGRRIVVVKKEDKR